MIAHAGNKGKGEEEIYHTFGPPLFIWYSLANTENEAHNTRMQKIAKLYTLFKKIQMGLRGSSLKRDLIPIKNTKNKGKGEKKSNLIPKKFRSYPANLAQELLCLVMIHLLRCIGLPCSSMKCKGIM